MEHSYARAGGGGVGSGVSGAGTSLLLVRRAPQCPDCHTQQSHDEDLIDVETVDNEPTPPLYMDEIPYWERALVDCDMIGEEEDLKPDWEEKLHSQAWNASQSLLLDEALVIIHTTRAAILTAGYAGARRAAARGGGARSLRALLGAPQTHWQPCLAQWLHNALTENLPTPLLVCYREIMLTMKGKVPVLVEKMTSSHPLSGRIQGAENGASGPTIASGNTLSDPSAPLLLLVPSGRDRRDARWAERLRAVAQVHIFHSHQSSWPPNLPISGCLSQLTASARTRTEALKADNPHRPLVLVGQGAGAAIAVQLAVSITGIAGIICLGLPLLTADGPRGTPEDCLLDLNSPVLFVIGQNSSNSSQQDAEILRSKLRVKSKLVVAGGADELLRLSRLKRQLEGVTQRMLECAIAEEVGNFLSFLSHQNDLGIGCSSPESYGGVDGDRDLLSNSPTLISAKREPSLSTNKRRHSPLNQKKKKRFRPIKTISPVKSRGSTLFELNNPPPEGIKANLGDILNSKLIMEEDVVPESSGIPSPPPKRSEPGSFIQITNNRLTRSIPITGNGLYDSISKGTGIKVLENIPFKSSNISGALKKGGISGVSGPAATPLALPPRRLPSIADDQQSSPISSTNIMDLPIIFADDNKSIDESKMYNHNKGASSVKKIIINKQQVIPSLEKNMPSSSQQSRNVVQVKIPSANQSTGSPTSHQSPNVNKSSMNNSVKYAKVILAKRAGESPKSSTDALDSSKTQVTNKPIIVKGKGNSLTTFKVLPGNMFQKNTPNVFQSKQRLIIKRAVVPSGLNISTGSQETKKCVEAPKVDGKSLRENSKDERAIEAAVASISSPTSTEDNTDFIKNMLENFD